MPDEDKKPEDEKPSEPKPEVKPETVPVYIERHELTSALDELKALLNAKTKADDDRYTALEARLTAKPKAEEKPKGEGEHATQEEVPGETAKPKPRAKRTPWRLWRTI